MKPGRSASGFQPTDRHGLHQARRPSGGVEISTCRRSYARLERGGCTGKPIDSSKRHLFSPDFSHRLCFADMPTNEHSYLSTLPSRRRPKMSSTCPTVFWRSCSSSVIFIKMFFSATSLRNENKDEKELANKQANTGKKKKATKKYWSTEPQQQKEGQHFKTINATNIVTARPATNKNRHSH